MAEVWLINENPVVNSATYEVSFTSNNISMKKIYFTESKDTYKIIYVSDDGGGSIVVYDESAGWADEAYRTIAYLEDSEGSFTTWLTGNAIQQSNIDISTLDGWSSLSIGDHSITLSASAKNYRTSDTTAAVKVTKVS